VIENLLIFLEQNIIPIGAGGVFLAGVIEEVIAPIPSALVMTAAGFLFVSGPVGADSIFKLILLVALPSAAGVTLGSLVVYGAAWWGGRALLDRWGRFLGLYWSDVEKLEAKLKESKKDEISVISARVIPIVPSVAISAFCGFIRMNLWKYLWITFLGMFIRAIILGSIGWQVGNVYHRYAEFISRLESLLFIVIGLLAAGFACYIFIENRKKNKNTP
jgi:membrane protein DedA with SNARE-associated domain